MLHFPFLADYSEYRNINKDVFIESANIVDNTYIFYCIGIFLLIKVVIKCSHVRLLETGLKGNHHFVFILKDDNLYIRAPWLSQQKIKTRSLTNTHFSMREKKSLKAISYS